MHKNTARFGLVSTSARQDHRPTNPRNRRRTRHLAQASKPKIFIIRGRRGSSSSHTVVLQLQQPRVRALRPGQEVGVAAVLHDPPVLHDRDAVHPSDRRQPVRHQDGGPPLHQPLQRLLQHALRLRVQRARRLVQQQDGRVLEHRPGDGDPLLLPARQLHAPLADRGPVPIGQLAHEAVHVRRLRRLDHLLLARAFLAVRDVFQDARREEDWLLLHQADLAPQGLQVQRPDVLAIDGHFPSARVVEPLDESNDGALP
uniref:Uncharacterized protein n=1 Tax=Zea mays TaxID=4577 RepID=C4J2J8_MAIZE|nr:unknown [Zea mays]